MSMEHKAFLFDSILYHKEIEPVIKKCCKSKNVEPAVEYIKENCALLRMPDSGENLQENWQDGCVMDLQGLFDILLTRCYEPNEDIGLEYAWDGVLEAIRNTKIVDNADLCVLGRPLAYSGITIDPGYEGLGIVGEDEVVWIKELLAKNKEKIEVAKIEGSELLYTLEPDELVDACDDLCMIYNKAVKDGKGILFTF